MESPKSFKGASTTYHVMGANPEGNALFGVGFSLVEQKLIVRFAYVGNPTVPLKHFTKRGSGGFMVPGAGAFKGTYLPKVSFPIVQTPTSHEHFAKLCDDLDLPEIISEWILRQFKLEGISLFGGAPNLAEIIKGLYAVPSDFGEVKSCFVLPQDLPSPAAAKAKPVAQGSVQGSVQGSTDLSALSDKPAGPQVPADLDSLTFNELCDLADEIAPKDYAALLEEESDLSEEEMAAALKDMLKQFVKGDDHDGA